MSEEELLTQHINQETESTPQTDAQETVLGMPLSKETSKKVLIKDRFEINFDASIPWLNNNGATAYAVSDRIDTARKLFALVCDGETSPRLSILPYLKSIDNPALLKLVEFGTVCLPETKKHRMVLIYEMPLGGKVFENGVCTLDFKNNHEKFKNVILSFLVLSETLKSMNITHRAIRPDNLYFIDENKSEIVIGDCIAAFPAYYQPAIYESIESLYADKLTRGNGNEKNDIYSIGMTALALYVGHEISTNITDAETLRLKIRKSSFSFISSVEKIPTDFSSLFKGMLNDDSGLRWGYSQVLSFFSGKQVSLGNNSSSERPKRALNIDGEKVYMPRDVVYSMHNNISEAYDLIIRGKLSDWAKNGLENEKLASQIDAIVKQELSSAGNKDLTIARISILIDHSLPIRYRNISFFPDGIAKAVFYEMKNKKSIKDYNDIFSTDLIKLWYQMQESLRAPGNITEFRVYIMRSEIGYGIERIIYDIDNDLPCISSLFENEFVSSAPQVLKALNASFEQINITSQPYDRSIIAFLRCKMGKKIDNYLAGLYSNRSEIKASAILQLYSMMQTKFGPSELVNLARWLVNYCKPMILVYHNKKYQKYLEKELVKIYQHGKLYEILNLLENEAALEKDRNDFAAILNEVNLLLLEKNKISDYMAKLGESARASALKLASFVSVLVMIASFAYNLISWVLN